MTTTPLFPADAQQIAADLETLRQRQPISDGPLAEQRHQFCDADPDTAYPLPGIAHPRTPEARS